MAVGASLPNAKFAQASAKVEMTFAERLNLMRNEFFTVRARETDI